MRNISGLPVIIICFPGSGDGDVQLAVDDGSVFHKTVAGKEVELPDVLDGETVDDDITLTALIALHGIDADLLQFRNAQLFDAFAHHGYLVAVRYDDAHRLLGIKPARRRNGGCGEAYLPRFLPRWH